MQLKPKSLSSFTRSLISGLAALTIPLTAVAQLEEIVVTAQKRSESLQDVPIAINAITGDTLDDLSIRDTDDIVKLFPGLSVQTSSAVNSGFTIRGVGTDNFHITGQQAVGQYMDGVSMVSPWTSTVGIWDMERVEVLKGPQNTLFGRNTTGGAVNFISRKPEVGGEVNGFARVSAGNEGRLDFEAALGVPVSDTMAARVTIMTENRDEIFNNLTPGMNDVGDIERHGLRASLVWEPNDETSLLLNGHANYSRGSRTPSRGLGIWNGDGVFPVNADTTGDGVADSVLPFGDPAILADLGPVHDCGVATQGRSSFEGTNNCVALIPRSGGGVTSASTADWNDVYDAGNPKADFDYEGVFLKLNHEFETISWESILSYDEITGDFLSTNATTATGAGFYPGQAGKFEVFSFENRLTSTGDGPFRWILGSYYSEEEDRLTTIINRTDAGAPPFGVVPSITIDQDVTILSVYGQAEFDFSDKTTLTIGLRFTDDSKEGNSRASVTAFTDNGRVPPAGGVPLPLSTYIPLDLYDSFLEGVAEGTCPPAPLPCQTNFDVEQDLEEIGGKIGLDHFINDDVMVYGSYSRGFKSGAFDTRALAAFAGTADKAVLPEFLDAYELGLKSTLMDGMVELNIAGYFSIWEDRQTFDVDDAGRPAFVNIPEAEIIGLEVEVKWAPDDTWFIQAGLNLQDSEITDAGGLLSISKGSRLSNTADESFTGLISKDLQLEGGRLTLQTNFKYQGDVNTALDDDPEEDLGSTFTWNARASYYFGDEEQHEVALWAENITEEKICGSKGTLDSLNYQFTCIPNAGMAFYGITLSTEF